MGCNFLLTVILDNSGFIGNSLFDEKAKIYCHKD